MIVKLLLSVTAALFALSLMVETYILRREPQDTPELFSWPGALVLLVGIAVGAGTYFGLEALNV